MIVIDIGDHSIALACCEDKSRDIWAQVWNSAMAMCQVLEQEKRAGRNYRRILELGAGKGLCGIFASFLFPEAKVVLTDVNEKCLEILEKTVVLNDATGRCKVEKLNWYDFASFTAAHCKDDEDSGFDLIIGSDILYMEKAVLTLPSVIDRLLKRTEWAQAILVDPNRCYSTFEYLSKFEDFSLSVNMEKIDRDKVSCRDADVKVQCQFFNVITVKRS